MVLVRLLELLAGFLLFIAMSGAPTMVAFGRRAQNWTAIGLVNTLLGWTIAGWVAALVWSVMAKPEQEEDAAPLTVTTTYSEPPLVQGRPLAAH